MAAGNIPEGFQKMEPNPTWDFENDPNFQGTFMAAETNVGPNHSNLYTFKRNDGSVVSVWGNSILDSRFKSLEMGQEVLIQYLGKVKSEKVKGRTYHNFEVYKRDIGLTDPGAETVEDSELPFD